MDQPVANEMKSYQILQSVPFPLFLLDENQHVYFVNKNWSEYTGQMLEAASGIGWVDCIHPDDQPGVQSALNAAYQNQKSFQLHLRLQDRVGEYSSFTAQLEPRLDEKSFFPGYTVVLVQVVNALQADINEMLQEQAANLEQLTAKLIQKNLEQERNNAELESFTYIASHDLQEPLRKIQSFSKMIIAKDAENLSAQAKDYFQRIMSAAERMQRLIDDLLSYSGTNVSDSSFETVSLDSVLQDVKESFQEIIEEKNVSITWEPLPELELIRFQVHQLFTNILANALKFSRPGLPVIIDIRASLVNAENIRAIEDIEAGTYWQISFADNGIGFEQQYEGRIFELFQRLHGKNEYIGTGIGLAICKKIVHNHHGYLTATGVPGEGSVFNIYLPAGNK